MAGIWDSITTLFREKQIDRNVATAQIGDLIEFVYPRAGFSHWGVYDGDGHVVHFGLADENAMQTGLRLWLQIVLGNPCGDILLGITKVRRQRIAEINVPTGAHIRVNNGLHRLTPSPRSRLKWRRDALLGEEFPYDLLNLNCEHFATFVRYGRAVCNQVPFTQKDEKHKAATRAFERKVPRFTMK